MFDEESEPAVDTIDGLVHELEAQSQLLISVATGGPRIDSVQGDYQRRRQRLIPALKRRGLEYPFPWPDLWQWYGHWSANLGSYASRRTHIRDLISPTLEALERQRSGLSVTNPILGTPPSWTSRDARVAGGKRCEVVARFVPCSQRWGSERAELRRLVRDAWDLAQKVTHGDLDRVDAFAAAQATVLVVRTLQEPALGRK